jgi:hypothetical protein
VTSEEGVMVRGKVWSEVLEELKKIRPDIQGIIEFQNEA